jgi:hypothetical protein
MEALQAPVQNTSGSLYYAAGDSTHWWDALTPKERDDLILFTFAGISDAIRRVARHIDEVEGASDGAGDD